MSPFGAIEFWHWWALGVVLIIVEVFAPGFVFAWLAVAAGLTGLVLFFAPGLSWQVQLLAFAGLAVASVVGWIYYVRRVARPCSSRKSRAKKAKPLSGPSAPAHAPW